MSTLRANTIETSTGGTVALSKQNAAKYFIHFGMNDFVIDTSMNNSSVVDEGVGHATCNFTTNMSQVRYSFNAYCNSWSADTSFSTSNCGAGVDYDTCSTKSATTGIGINNWYNNASIDGVINCIQTFGELA